jgi:hypothetical protein
MAAPALPSIHARESLFAFIRPRLRADGALDDPSMSLPDEGPRDPTVLALAAGARDGIASLYGSVGQDPGRAAEIAQACLAAITHPGERELHALYDAVADDDVLSYLDALIDRLGDLEPPTCELGEVARWLATTSPDRGPTKVGLALLGVTAAPDAEILHILGAHEEFTLYACVAFANSRVDPEPELFALAQRVNGWGRIHCVSRLKDTDDPAIRRWLLRGGYRNSVMNEYLAFTAATTGRLAAALATEAADRELLTAAGEIIDALLVGGPVEDIDDYPEAPVALTRYVWHMETAASTVADFLTVAAIDDFLSSEGWPTRVEASRWTWASRARLHRSCRSVLERPDWPAIIEQELASDDRAVFWKANAAARRLGIDTFERHLAALALDPIDGPWYHAWEGADLDRAEILADLAASRLDLRAIASGPSTAIGVGPEFDQHAALDWTLQALPRFPGVGGNLVLDGLRSPSVQNRAAAIAVLEAWTPEHWTAAHRDALCHVAANDPHQRTRHKAEDVLAAARVTASPA